MLTADFLRSIWPSTGLYVVARLVGKGWRHQVCNSVEEAAHYVADFDRQGVPTYMACGVYRDAEVITTRPNGDVWRQVRVTRNVRALRCLWMDLDVKPGVATAYESQEAAIDGLVAFCGATYLPIPMVISSGVGIHIYWTLENEILPEAWKPVAESLKTLAAKHGFKADPACTADPARVLRPVGTWNRKDPANPRPVELVAEAPACNFSQFKSAVDAALKRAGLEAPKEAVRQVESATEGINQAFAVTHSFPPCSIAKVADRCKQVAAVRDTRGNVPEPHWYSFVQLACHSIEGDPLTHLWSQGYAGYTEGETSKKIAQVRSQSLGPSLCSTFESRNPGGCDACPFRGKISSPAQLGTQVVSAPAPTVEVRVGNKGGVATVVQVTLPKPPSPFTRGETGGIYTEVDGITHKIYEYDFFPTEIAYDEQLGYETTRFRHWLPEEGWKECVLQSSLLARPVDFESKLRDNHIQPLIRNQVAQYADAYLRSLRTDTKMRKLYKSQGWKTDDTEFVLGDKLYRADGVFEAGFSSGMQSFLSPFRSKGELAIWRAATCVFEHPGLEAHAFVLLLAFASPLLKLAGRQGFTVSALGESGVGKSTMARMMSSVYGHPDEAWCKRLDTKLARIQRFGAHSALPVYMDEATTIPNDELRDLIYEIPTGKGRDSMKRDYTLREGAEWSTIFVTSTNDSLQAKLQLEKQNAEAESLRLFEFKFPRIPDFADISKMLPGIVADNYGVAGAEFIRRLVADRDAIKMRLTTVVEEAEREFGMEGKERFWSQAIALTLFGGHLAHEWGIIDFNPDCIKSWLRRETLRMRGHLADSMVTSVTVLGEYLNAHIGERLTVTKMNENMTAQHTRPSRELSQRYEKDQNLIFVPRQHIRHWLDAQHFNYSDTKDDLYSRGILLNPDARKILGAGTDMTGAQVPCWKIKSNHPELSPVLDGAE